MMADILAALVRTGLGCQARWQSAPIVDQACIYYANHSSHLDALTIWSSLPAPLRRMCRPVAAADYWLETPFRRWLAEEVFHAIVIERKKVTGSTNPLPMLLEALDRGESLIFFPEGGRGDGEELGTFRSGLWHLAHHRPEVPLVPVWLENLNRVLPKGEFLPVPVICAVTFGKPLDLDPEQDRRAFLDGARDAIIQIGSPSSQGAPA